MKTMNHILPRLILIPIAAALVAVSCNKNVGEGVNVALKRQFDAWRAIHYPAAQEKDGIYIIEDIPGTGREWDDDLPVTFLTYTMRDLDGTVTYNTDEQWAKQMGTWTRTGYYGPQITLTGEDASYAGLDVLLDGMRQGGTRTAIIPSWMLTYKRYDSPEKYLENSTDAASTIYTITFLDQTENLKEYEFRNLSTSTTPAAASPTDRCSTPPSQTPPRCTISTMRPRPTPPFRSPGPRKPRTSSWTAARWWMDSPSVCSRCTPAKRPPSASVSTSATAAPVPAA